MSSTITACPAWNELTAACPRLLEVERWARQTRFSWYKYEDLKRTLQPLVGWSASPRAPKILTTSDAWDIALQHCLRELERRVRR